MSSSVLRRSQIGVEATVGTPPAASAFRQLVGAMTGRNAPVRELREEYRASMAGSNTYDDLAYASSLSYAGRCVYGELPYWLAASITGTIPVTGSAPSCVWTATAPLGTIPALKPLTIYVGDNTAALRSAACYITRLVISGDSYNACRVAIDFIGREQVAEAFPVPAATNPVNETARNLMNRVYIGDATSTIGAAGSEQSQTWYSFTWTYNTGVTPDYSMSGVLDMMDIQRDVPTCTLEMTAKWNAGTLAEFAKWRDPSAVRLIRLHNSGAATNAIDIDGAYVYTDFNAIDNERDGTTITRLTATAVENTVGTFRKKIEVAVTNNLASFPV